ncbi:hypothetical protein LTAR_01627 [Leptolinea tardivitalis]|nr:hypothetical protein LTAR_01627 [Leptolinea tardivitalis]
MTAMAVSALIFHRAGDAAIAGTIVGILSILIFTVYECTRGWRAWETSQKIKKTS